MKSQQPNPVSKFVGYAIVAVFGFGVAGVLAALFIKLILAIVR